MPNKTGGEVRNDRRTRMMAKIIFGQLAVGLLIVAISLGVIFYGQGYRYDFKHFRVIKTGVVYLEFLPHDVTVTIDEKSKNRFSNYVANIRPGSYSVVISKKGYTTWTTQVKVDSGSVSDNRDIVLFKSEITSTELTDQGKIDLITAPLDILAANSPGELSYNDYEIWVGDDLVTRFSDTIKHAIWYPDLAHVVYQKGNEIHVIENGGQNDTLLVTLSSSSKTQFTIGSKGAELYYLDGNTYKIAVIR